MGSQFVSLADLAQLGQTPAPAAAPSNASIFADLFGGLLTGGAGVASGFIVADSQKDIAKLQGKANSQIASINSQTNIEIARIQAKAAADLAASQLALNAQDPFAKYVMPLVIGAGVLTIGGIGLVLLLGRRR